jgi:type I restriction enzyme S subunit
VNELKRLESLLRQKREVVVAHPVTKGLNPSVTMKSTGTDRPGDMPEHWELWAMRSVAKVTRGASPRPAGDPRYFGGDAVPWVTVGEITRDDRMELTETRTCLTEAGARRSWRFAKGTVVYSNSGDTLGVPKILGMDACVNDGVAAFENLSPEVDPRFLCFFLGSITAAMREKARQGSGQPNLNTEIVKAIRFGLPPMSEQLHIVRRTAEWTEGYCSLAIDAQREVGLLGKRWIALVQAGGTGQFDFTRHD